MNKKLDRAFKKTLEENIKFRGQFRIYQNFKAKFHNVHIFAYF